MRKEFFLFLFGYLKLALNDNEIITKKRQWMTELFNTQNQVGSAREHAVLSHSAHYMGIRCTCVRSLKYNTDQRACPS